MEDYISDITPKITVEVHSGIKTVNMHGVYSGQIDVTNTGVEKLSMSGAGSIALVGYKKQLTLKAEGSTNVNAVQFMGDALVAMLDGVSVVQVNDSTAVQKHLSGLGKVVEK